MEPNKTEYLHPYDTGIFSGRFDPPHLGHLITILRLANRYGKIVIVILDYPEREACTAERAMEILDTVFNLIFSAVTRSKIDVIMNKVHFGKITFSEYDLLLRNIGACFNHTVYLSGNDEVIKNFEKQQIPYERVARSIDDTYSGTEIRKEMGKTGKQLKNYCDE
jgi:nicotinamide mononucleotide adenylyltransferase